MKPKIPIQLLFLPVFALAVFFRFGALGNLLYSHDETGTSLFAAGHSRSEFIKTSWDGRELTASEIQYFLQPSKEKDIFDTLSAIAAEDPAQSPLYYGFSHYWMRWFGHSPGAMRSLAALFSLFAIPGMFWFCMELFHSRRTALLSAVLISLSPFSILFAQDARPYSLWAAMTLISSAAFLYAVRKNQNSTWAIYSLSLMIGLYSQQLFALVAVAHGLSLVSMKQFRLEGRLARYLVSAVLALITYTPWLMQTFTHWDVVMGNMEFVNMEIPWSQYIQRWALIFSAPFIDLSFGPRNSLPYILRAPVLLLIVYSLYYLGRSTPRRMVVFLFLLIGMTTLPLILPDLLRGGIRSIQGRYLISANVATIPVVAHLLIEKLGLHRAAAPIKWYLITALLVTAQIISGFNILREQTWWTKNLSVTNPQVVDVLNQASHPLLIVYGMGWTNLGDVLALSYAVDQDVRFKLYQAASDVEIPRDISDIYLFQQNYWNMADSLRAKHYQATEVVPNRLWRIDDQGE